jgi:hypothetical protein
MQITIASINTSANKLCTVQTTDGRKGLAVWKSQLDKLNIQGGGSTYEVETESWNDKTIITKATPIAAASTPSPTPVNGAILSGGFRTPEQMFVSEVLTAYISNGRCEPEKLTETINYIRKAWTNTFGFSVFTPSEAGKHAA